MELKLTYYGDPILRKKADKVEEIDDALREMVERMKEIMLENRGIGLAAPQANRSLRLFISKVPQPDPEDPEQYIEGEWIVFINPKLSEPSKESWVAEEGCLSIPGVYGRVERPYSITVEWTDLDGNTQKETFSGLQARCIMHENDHINGTLFLDRLEAKEKKGLEQALKKVKNQYTS